MAVFDDLIRRRAGAALEAISREGRVRAAFLFGSHVAGTADRFSDIDIAAFVEEFDLWDIRRRARTAVQAQKRVGDDVEVHFFRAESLDNPPPASFVAYILRHGVLIEGTQ